MTKKINLLNSSLDEKLEKNPPSLRREGGGETAPFTEPQKKLNKIQLPKKLIYLFVFLIVALTLFSSGVNKSDQSSWVDKLPIIGQIKHLVESADNELKGEGRDQINILLLGMGGKNHEGGYLTDTIMLASMEPSSKKVVLLSIPRDMSVPIENMGWRKVNNINAFAEAKDPGSGGLAVSQALSDVLGIPVDYYARVDFAGFEKIIDELDGIKVYVDNTLDDYKYPIAGMEDALWEERFEHLHIDQGWQKMDGELTLKYVRSRHAVGIEGSDFARARRQQKVIQAIKDKLMSKFILFKPSKITNIVEEIKENFSSNLKIWEMIKLWNMFKDIESENITSKVLDDSPNGLLTSMIAEDGAYLLIPRSGDFAEIQYLINNIFTEAPPEDKTKVAQEKATIEVRNGTWVNGLASQVAIDLERYGFDVIRLGNASQQNFQKSVIYDLTYGEKIQSLAVLKNKTDANVSLGLPQWLMDDLAKELSGETNPIQPDFILILGQDADKTKSGTENVTE